MVGRRKKSFDSEFVFNSRIENVALSLRFMEIFYSDIGSFIHLEK